MDEQDFTNFVRNQPQLQHVQLEEVYLGPGDSDHMCSFLRSHCNFLVFGTFSSVIEQMQAYTRDYHNDST